LTLEQVIKVAKVMEARSYSKDFKGTVKQMLGTWYGLFSLNLYFSVSIGCTVNNEHPKKIIEKINQGIIDV